MIKLCAYVRLSYRTLLTLTRPAKFDQLTASGNIYVTLMWLSTGRHLQHLSYAAWRSGTACSVFCGMHTCFWPKSVHACFQHPDHWQTERTISMHDKLPSSNWTKTWVDQSKRTRLTVTCNGSHSACSSAWVHRLLQFCKVRPDMAIQGLKAITGRTMRSDKHINGSHCASHTRQVGTTCSKLSQQRCTYATMSLSSCLPVARSGSHLSVMFECCWVAATTRMQMDIHFCWSKVAVNSLCTMMLQLNFRLTNGKSKQKQAVANTWKSQICDWHLIHSMIKGH